MYIIHWLIFYRHIHVPVIPMASGGGWRHRIGWTIPRTYYMPFVDSQISLVSYPKASCSELFQLLLLLFRLYCWFVFSFQIKIYGVQKLLPETNVETSEFSFIFSPLKLLGTWIWDRYLNILGRLIARRDSSSVVGECSWWTTVKGSLGNIILFHKKGENVELSDFLCGLQWIRY